VNSPVPRARPPADYRGCPITVDQALARGVTLRPPRWGIPDAVVALLGFVVLSVIVAVVAGVAGLPFWVTLLLGVFVPWLALGGWPLLTTSLQGNGPVIDLGITLRWKDVGWGLLGGVAALVAGSVVAVIVQAIAGDVSSAAADLGKDLRNEAGLVPILVFAAAVGFGAPIVEELAFRGLGYNALAKRGLPTWAVIVITTVAFSLFHLEPVRIPILLASGAILAVLRWQTRGVGAPIVAHMVNNVPGAAFLLWG
jgi:membrane protease YdiL (CAAX protease family)